MSYNIDGFNERTNYIRNSNDINRINKNGPNSFDNSFAKMRSEERKNLVSTTNQDKTIVNYDVRGNRDNFLIRNNAMNNVNQKPIKNNPVSNALNKNMFRK